MAGRFVLSQSTNMQLNFVAFKNAVLGFCRERQEESDNLKIEMQVFKFCHANRGFLMQAKKILSPGLSGGRVEIVTVKCVVNKLRGTYQPCLLVRQLQNEQKSSIYHVMLLESADSLFLLGSFRINDAKALDELSVSLLNGPAVCWLAGDSVYFARYDYTAEGFTVDSVFIDTSIGEESRQDFALLWCGGLENEIIVMGTKSEMIDGACSLVKWICAGHSEKTVQENPLVPDMYAAIATCCCIMIPQGHGSLHSNAVDRFIVCLATNTGQLLRFDGGLLKKFWQLPFDDPCEICTLEPEIDEVILIVHSRTRRVCAVNCKNDKIVKEWYNIETVLIGDFLECGTDQILLLTTGCNMTETEGFSKFTLVDITRGMIPVEHSQEVSDTHPQQPKSDSLQRTAAALRTQLQAGAASLHEAKLECNEKLRMVEQCCQVAKSIASSCSGKIKTRQEKIPGLFCLLEGALVSDDATSEAKPEFDTESNLTVREIWQRTVCNHWIVGVDVENSGTSRVSDLVLGLVSCQRNQVEFSSKPAFSCDNIRFHDHLESEKTSQFFSGRSSAKPPSLKRTKFCQLEEQRNCQFLLPGSSTRLTVHTSVPTFCFQETFTVSVVLTWTSYQSNGRFYCHAIHCGYVTLQSDEIINGSLQLNKKLDNKSLQQDVAALKSISLETQLILQSDNCCLQRVIPILKTTSGLPILETDKAIVSGEIYTELLSRAGDNSALAGVGIIVHSQLHKGRLTLVTRNESQVYLLLHGLRQVIPDVVSICPDYSFERSAVQSSIRAMNHEVTSLQQNLRDILQKTRGRENVDEKGVHGKEINVENLRRDYERKRVQALGETEFTSETEDFEKLWNDLVRDRLATDHSVGKVSSF